MSRSLDAAESRGNESRLLLFCWITCHSLLRHFFSEQRSVQWCAQDFQAAHLWMSCSQGTVLWGADVGAGGMPAYPVCAGFAVPMLHSSGAQPRLSVSLLSPSRSAGAPWGAVCPTAAAWTSLRSGHFSCVTCTLWRWSLKVGASCSPRGSQKDSGPSALVCKVPRLSFFKSQCTVLHFLSDTLLAYWNKFSPQELINVLMLLEWVSWGCCSNPAPLCGQSG